MRLRLPARTVAPVGRQGNPWPATDACATDGSSGTGQKVPEMALAEDHYMIQALLPDAANHPLAYAFCQGLRGAAGIWSMPRLVTRR